MENAYPGLAATIFFLFKLLFNYVTSPPYPLSEVPKRYFLYNSPLQKLYMGEWVQASGTTISGAVRVNKPYLLVITKG